MLLDRHDPKDEDTIINANSYLSRYHASERILKAYGIKLSIPEVRKVFPLITDNHIEGLNEEQIKSRHIKAKENLLDFIKNYNHPLSYDQMSLEELEDVFLDECYKNKADLNILRQLLQLGAKVSTPFPSGTAAYVRGIKVSDEENLEFFLKNGANINYQYPNLEIDGQPYYLTLFLRILSSASLSAIKLMLEYGAQYLDKNRQGENCLHLVAHANVEAETITIFIDLGLDPNAQNKKGESVLHYLAEYPNTLKALETALQAGADPNLRSHLGQSPIYHTIARQFTGEKTISLLAKYGANLDIVDAKGNSPLHLAAHQNREQALIQLLKEGADPKLKDNAGKTAYDIALEKGHLTLAKQIKEDAEKDYQATAVYPQIQKLKRQILHALKAGKSWKSSDKEGWAIFGKDNKGYFYQSGEHLTDNTNKSYFSAEKEGLEQLYQLATSWRDRNEKTELDCWKTVLSRIY